MWVKGKSQRQAIPDSGTAAAMTAAVFHGFFMKEGRFFMLFSQAPRFAQRL
jgi:hypothetical protein